MVKRRCCLSYSNFLDLYLVIHIYIYYYIYISGCNIQEVFLWTLINLMMFIYPDKSSIYLNIVILIFLYNLKCTILIFLYSSLCTMSSFLITIQCLVLTKFERRMSQRMQKSTNWKIEVLRQFLSKYR